MKWASFIFMFVIFIQVFFPCRDRLVPDFQNSRIERSVNKAATQHNDADECGPFCTCSCCASPTIVQLAAEFSLTEIIDSPNYSEYTSSEKHGISMNIWQPPRFVA